MVWRALLPQLPASPQVLFESVQCTILYKGKSAAESQPLVHFIPLADYNRNLNATRRLHQAMHHTHFQDDGVRFTQHWLVALSYDVCTQAIPVEENRGDICGMTFYSSVGIGMK